MRAVVPTSGAVCLMLICLLTACGEEEITPVSVNFVETMRHQSGFSVKRPEGYSATLLAEAIHMLPEFAGRSTPTLVFTRQARSPTRPDTESRTISGVGQVFFALEKMENPGSGGPQHELTAWRAIGDEWIVAEATSLVEWPAEEADYDVLWAVLATAEIP